MKKFGFMFLFAVMATVSNAHATKEDMYKCLAAGAATQDRMQTPSVACVCWYAGSGPDSFVFGAEATNEHQAMANLFALDNPGWGAIGCQCYYTNHL